MTDHALLLARLRDFVIGEAKARRDELRERWARPLAERVVQGRALQGLRVREVRPDRTVMLACERNESRFREGDMLVLHRGEPAGADSLRGVIEYDDETELEVNITTGMLATLQETPRGWIADEDLLDMSPFFLDALDEVGDTLRGREQILPLLSGAKRNTLDFARYERALEYASEAGLDEAQSEALAEAYACDLFHLIQGPPGTGKTFVLAHLVLLLVGDGERVFVSALTHRAINNALDKIYKLDSVLPVCKIGRRERARGLLAPNFDYFAESGFGEIPGGYVVGATPFATRGERLAHVEFDVVIFDEASQITLPLAIMGMLSGARYVFIGDERQLPPVGSGDASELGRESIFGYLSGRGGETMLTQTYRLNDALAGWPSRAFYEGRLRPAPGIGERRLQTRRPFGERWKFALDPGRPAVFLDLAHHNSTVRSRREAEVVAELVLELLAAGLPGEEIGVVAPYRAQGRAIRNLLRTVLPEREDLKALVVDTVERMQGQEREVVLVSLTTSSAGFAARLAKFFFQPERLNVAITRPRTKLILIGSRHVLEAQVFDPELEAWVAMLRDLLDHCTEFSLPGGRV